MNLINSRKLEGLNVMTTDGHNVGEVVGLFVDTTGWEIIALELKLLRPILEQIEMKKPLLGTTTVKLPVSWINGVADAITLKHALEGLRFSPEDET